MQSTPLVAFDQHAATTVAAVLLPGQRAPALQTLVSDSPTIVRFVRRVQRAEGTVQCCYEAGPGVWGYRGYRAQEDRQHAGGQGLPRLSWRSHSDCGSSLLVARRPGTSSGTTVVQGACYRDDSLRASRNRAPAGPLQFKATGPSTAALCR
jgi:hypothetical protein